eukprot:CAMPEP_0170779996 /NCGR_PEP_ID=MMETSP0733-20121128/13308_1 /TAXON_ID=186038 /ORGANISM="Fragilariopsis kerguelensis, Strain L26-C5" /LENGTH=39 /DNA_ID= /DNA_START= /DNA_END= /DNA_ORIENTATION=
MAWDTERPRSNNEYNQHNMSKCTIKHPNKDYFNKHNHTV